MTLKTHLNEAPVMLPSVQQGTGFYMIECAMLFFLQCFELSDAAGQL